MQVGISVFILKASKVDCFIFYMFFKLWLIQIIHTIRYCDIVEIQNRRALFQRNAAWAAFLSGSGIRLVDIHHSVHQLQTGHRDGEEMKLPEQNDSKCSDVCARASYKQWYERSLTPL